MYNRVETAIILFFKSTNNKPIHGYALVKALHKRGLTVSHQIVYKTLRDIGATYIKVPKLGKPDVKIYDLSSIELNQGLMCDFELAAAFIDLPDYVQSTCNHFKSGIKQEHSNRVSLFSDTMKLTACELLRKLSLEREDHA